MTPDQERLLIVRTTRCAMEVCNTQTIEVKIYEPGIIDFERILQITVGTVGNLHHVSVPISENFNENWDIDLAPAYNNLAAAWAGTKFTDKLHELIKEEANLQAKVCIPA